jgi:cell division protein FtsQ
MSSWRFSATIALLSTLALLVRQPYWQLRSLEQITIEGNQLLSDQQIKTQLSLQLPLNLWHIQPKALEQILLQGTQPRLPVSSDLESSRASLFLSVVVHRRLIPAGLDIQVKERQPVARCTVNGIPGFVDQQGYWFSFPPAPAQIQNPSLPSLTLLGCEQHPPHKWASLLNLLQESTIPIHSIDWSGDTLLLETAIGKVHFGVFTDQISVQIATLNQMRDLKSYFNYDASEIDYIDLSSPTVPTIQLTPAAAAKRWEQS